MSTLRSLIGLLSGTALVTVAMAALVPTAEVPSLQTTQTAEPAQFTEIERRDLTPRKTRHSEYSSPDNLGTRHRVFLGLAPRTYDALAAGGEGRPMIVLLHGAGRDGRAMLDMWKVAARTHGLTLVAPNATGGSWDLGDAEPLLEIIADAQARYKTSPGQVYMFGHSAGAVIAQALTNYVDGPWRAVATHGGYLQADAIQAVGGGGVPVRVYLGSSDGIFNPSDARKTAQAFAANGHDSEFHLIPEHGHWYYQIGPKLASETAEWFLTQ